MSFSFFNDDDLYKSRNKKFDRLLQEGVDVRELEVNLMKPNPLKKISLVGKMDNKLKIVFYFKDDEEINLVKKHFRVLDYIEMNVGDSSLLVKLLREKEKNDEKEREWLK